MDVKEYIKPELLVMVPVLYVIGMMIKRTKKIDDRLIPSILGVVGIVLACVYVLGTEPPSMIGAFTAFTQGVLAAGMAVYINQQIKQAKKADSRKEM